MTKKIHMWVAVAGACAAALATLPAQAQTQTNRYSGGIAESGLYVGGSLGHSRFKGDTAGLPIDRSDWGGKGYVGYEFTPNIALELGYANLGKFSGGGASIEGHGFFLDAVGKVPFTQQLSGLARVGAFNGKSKISGPFVSADDRNTQPKVGLGLQYDVTRNLALRAEWERYRFEAFGDKENTDLISAGMNYRF